MRLYFFPSILYFGMPMGLIGAGLNARHLMELFDLQNDISLTVLFYGWITFIVVSIHYILHLFRATLRDQLIEEWHDPFRRSFLPAITLTAIIFFMSIAQVLETYYFIDQAWLLSVVIIIAIIHLALNLFLLNGWFFDSKVQLNQHQPTWFILLSGNFVIVIALMSSFGTQNMKWLYELSYFYFSIAVFLWIAFSTTLFYRLIFFSPLQVKLRPSLFIFLAPPSLACIASLFISDTYIQTGSMTVDSVGIITWISFSFATLMLLIWLMNYRFFYSSGLTVAGWSYVYPVAAYGLASQYLAQALNSQLLVIYSLIIFLILVGFILLLSVWFIKLVYYALKRPKIM